MNLQILTRAATLCAQKNFVTDMNERVQSGKNLSISELAKLVKFADVTFQSACDKLAITVLQTKLMVAVQDGHIDCIEIPHSHTTDAESPIAEKDLAASLWAAIKNSTHQEPMSPEFEDVLIRMKSPRQENKKNPAHNAVTTYPDITIGTVFSAVTKFYVEGIKANRYIFQKPKAADYLAPIPTKIFMPAFPEVQNLAGRIERYGVHKLDLPALAR